jgi:hypothetical protein
MQKRRKMAFWESMTMNTPSPICDYQWVLVVTGTALFGLWEIVDHAWLMNTPMNVQHGLHIAVTTTLLTLMTLTAFAIVRRYEGALRQLNAELKAKNEALELLESSRDKRLFALAQNLSLSLAELATHAQFALQSTTELPNIKNFAAAIDQANSMYAVARDLLQLSEMKPGESDMASDIPTGKGG